MNLVLCAALGYVVGSVPWAFLIARRSGGPDIRAVGSGNVGASNVLRTAGSGAALITALLDAAKGAAPVLLVRCLGGQPAEMAVAGVAAVAGHVYPVWLGFRGGKGVSTTLGACLAWSPPVAGLAAVIFMVVVALGRIVSLGSLLAAIAVGPIAFAWEAPRPIVIALFVAGWLIVFRHRGNLMRLAAGTERRLGDPQGR